MVAGDVVTGRATAVADVDAETEMGVPPADVVDVPELVSASTWACFDFSPIVLRPPPHAPRTSATRSPTAAVRRPFTVSSA